MNILLKISDFVQAEDNLNNSSLIPIDKFSSSFFEDDENSTDQFHSGHEDFVLIQSGSQKIEVQSFSNESANEVSQFSIQTDKSESEYSYYFADKGAIDNENVPLETQISKLQDELLYAKSLIRTLENQIQQPLILIYDDETHYESENIINAMKEENHELRN